MNRPFPTRRISGGNIRDERRRETVVCVEVIVQRETDLFEVIFALGSPSGLTGLLHGRQQQGHQDGDDRDDDQQLDERETRPGSGIRFQGGKS